LSVYAQNVPMGSLSKSASGALKFGYHSGWLERQDAYPMSLSLPLSEQTYREEVIAVLDNLLPDLAEVRSTIATRVQARGTDPFSLLWEVGRDCVGALQFIPEHDPPPDQQQVAGEALDDAQVGEILRALATTPLGVNRETQDLRISIAGAQEKTALLNIEGTWHRPSGATPSSHIIKPALGTRGHLGLSQSVENEHVCMNLVRAMGLEAAETYVHTFDGTRALVIKRFDRVWRGDQLIRIPQEDLCQAFGIPSHLKYEADGGPSMTQILELLAQSDDPSDDQKRFLQANYVFWLLGATDGHAKNFSISLGAHNSFRLTPIYDVISLQPLVDAHQVNRREYRMAMSVGNSRHYKVMEILPRHFLQSAANAGIKEARARAWIDEMTQRLPSAIELVGNATDDPMQAAALKSIAAGATQRAELAH